ncbi:MAG TPA: pseudouridine synthase, partial [Burkholderiaceae bacterium]|nr:pseudouridine synthase [Burkholderiaceae bacterium]
MVTLKLKKSPAPSEPGGQRRAPVRGNAARKRPTLAEAQAEREAAAARRAAEPAREERGPYG